VYDNQFPRYNFVLDTFIRTPCIYAHIERAILFLGELKLHNSNNGNVNVTYVFLNLNSCKYIFAMCMSDFRREFGFDIGFIDHFNTQLVITLNYSAITNLHTLQTTSAHVKSFPAYSVFSSGCLVTASNNAYSSASVLKFFLNGGSLPTEISRCQSHFTIDGLPPISSSWRQAPRDSRPDIF
jgi:hypothetical protein